MTLLISVMGAMAVSYIGTVGILQTYGIHGIHWRDVLLAPLYAGCMAPMAVLLIRNNMGAFWLLVLVAGGLATWSSDLANFLPLEGFDSKVFTALILIVAGTGLWSGRRLWLYGQDTGFAEKEFVVNLKGGFGFFQSNETRVFKKRSAFVALLRKEFLLQQVNLLLLGLSFFLFMASMIWMSYSEAALENHMTNVLMGAALMAFFSPYFIGAVMVAEERKMQLDTWHMTFPPSKRFQWLVKISLCLSLALLVSGFMHILLNKLGHDFPDACRFITLL